MTHRRKGKVARLPKVVRDEVNHQLENGKTYAQIVQWLAANGHPGFNHDNLYQWYNGGFQDWINHRDEVQNLHDIATGVVARNDDSKARVAARHIGTNLIFETLLKFKPDKLVKRLNRKPEHFTSLLNSFTRLNP